MNKSPLRLLLSLFFAGLLAGCETRSISDSGPGYGYNRTYRGELNELQVLGAASSQPVTTADIQTALASPGVLSFTRGEKILLVQSGAEFPDEAMSNELKPSFQVVGLSGMPPDESAASALDMSLRLAAARTGARAIVVYWGVLEVSRKNYATKTISWVPVVGFFLADENEQMRIRLKAAIIDVATGHWEILAPNPDESQMSTYLFSRNQGDQALVEAVKTQGYKRLAAELVRRAS